MSMNWEEQKEGQFADTPKMEMGRHDPVTIVRTARAKGDGTEYVTRDGVQQLMVIFANDDGAEHQNFYDLGGKNGWSFMNLVVHAGLDTEKLKEDDIGFEDFYDAEFASTSLVNRTLGIDLNHAKSGGERLYARSFATEAQEQPMEELPADDDEISPDEVPF